MDPTGVLLAPLRAGRQVARAFEDLNTIAERARRDPDPVEEIRARLDTLIGAVSTLNREASALIGATERLRLLGAEIVSGGRDLVETGEGVERRGAEIVTGGQDLTAVAQSLDDTLRVFRAALPRLLQGLDTAEQLEEAVETVAETVEPLQGAAKRVGRVTRRLGSDRR
jgi:DNA repair ATPase RecN